VSSYDVISLSNTRLVQRMYIDTTPHTIDDGISTSVDSITSVVT